MTMVRKQNCDRRLGVVSCAGIVVPLVLLIFLCGLLAPAQSYAEEMRLLSISLRGRISGATMLGEQQPEEFQEYDLAANFGLPWQR